jgi:superfamily II DNA/RNA helicase
MSATFADLGVPARMLAVLDAQGLSTPFPIQAATLPDALAGRDVCGRAPTGSGKTLAFAIPAVLSVRPAAPAGRRAERRGGLPGRPQALILVPTRELAAQVERTFVPLARAAAVSVTAVYGGVGYGPQRNALRRGVQVVVGCPGRLEDLVAQGDLDLGDVRLVVVDEADRMADMGFLPAVRRLLDTTPHDRQTLLFSATLDGEVDVLVSRYQRSPRRHEVASEEADRGDVRHVFWKADTEARVGLTADLVRAYSPAVVFCRTRHGAERLTKRLGALGVHALPIHGDRTQVQREKALAAFSAGRVAALVATDVAARGIHVDAVACVVHYDLPADAKDYVHRSGRTGRAGADGLVVSFVGRDQFKTAKHLQRAVDATPEVVAPDMSALPAPTQWKAQPAGDEGVPPIGEFHPVGGGRRPGAQRSGPPRAGQRQGTSYRGAAPRREGGRPSGAKPARRRAG